MLKELKVSNINHYLNTHHLEKDIILYQKEDHYQMIINLCQYVPYEASLAVLCAIVGLFDRYHYIIRIDDAYHLYYQDHIVGKVETNEYTVIDLYEDFHIQEFQLFIGLKTFLNIYINLLETHQFQKIKDFSQDIKK